MSRSFDRVDDYINVGTMGNFGTNLDTNFFTFSAWVKSSDSTHVMALCGTFNTGTVTGIQVQVNTQDGSTLTANRIFIFRRDEAGLLNSGYYSSSINDGKWHHIVVTNSNLAISAWEDGVSKSITAVGGANANNMANFAFPMLIGARSNRATPDLFFSGNIAHASFDSTSSPPTQSTALQLMRYPGSIPVSGGYLPFWGGSPEGDYSRNGNNGTVTNGTAFSNDNPPINGIMKKKRSSLHYATMFPVSAGGAVIDTGASNDLFSYVFTG